MSYVALTIHWKPTLNNRKEMFVSMCHYYGNVEWKLFTIHVRLLLW